MRRHTSRSYGRHMTTTHTTTTNGQVAAPTRRNLDDALLEMFRERADRHDASGTFPHDDLADLRAARWLAAAAPTSHGGLGLDLAELASEQRRLARYAPATALATCMHHYWVGTAATLLGIA